MENDIVIKAEHVSKKFCQSLKHVMVYGAWDISRDFLGIKSKTENLRKGEFWAVDNVSLELNRGRTLGIIGPNGSGKSTILKMLNGIYMPDKGKIQIKGRVGALIEIGAGFHPMLTGRENIYINGSILGMNKKEIDKKFDEIVEFADIGDFIDSPVKHYSSGMFVRLGFSIAVHCEPSIFLVDEVLAVGDARFYNKCTTKISELTAKNTTIVLVSHNMWLIQTMCNQVILLNQGRIIKAGKPIDCVFKYSTLDSEDQFPARWSSERELPVIVKHIEIQDDNANVVEKVKPDASLNIFAKYQCREENFKGHFLLRVTTPNGYPLYTSYSDIFNFNRGEGTITARIPSVSLLQGEYQLWLGVCGKKKERKILHAIQLRFYVDSSPSYPESKYGLFFNKVIWNPKDQPS